MSATLAPEVRTPDVARGDSEIAVSASIHVCRESARRLDVDVRLVGPEGGCIEIAEARGDEVAAPCMKVAFLRDDNFAAFRTAMQWAFSEIDRMRPMGRDLFVPPGETFPLDVDDAE